MKSITLVVFIELRLKEGMPGLSGLVR